MDNVLATVQELLQRHFQLQPQQVTPESNLADLGVDSLATIEFMFHLEEAFDVSLTEFRDPVQTVGDIAAFVRKAQLAQAAVYA